MCSACRRAKLTPFEKVLGELAAGILPKENGSLQPIIERVNSWRLWAEELPNFGRSGSALAVHELNSLCQQAQLVSMGADVQQASIQDHSEAFMEA